MAKFNSAKDSFLVQHTDFSLREQVKYPNGGQSRFYDNGTDMVIIDEDICTHDTGKPIFSYMLITDKQNNYMHQFKRVFRFLGYTQAEVEQYLSKEEITLSGDYLVTVGDRGEQLDVVFEKVLESPQIIKTPVVRNGKQSTLGYQPDVWKGWK